MGGYHHKQNAALVIYTRAESCSVADKVREYDQKILELCGWKEGKVVSVFSIITLILCIIGISVI